MLLTTTALPGHPVDGGELPLGRPLRRRLQRIAETGEQAASDLLRGHNDRFSTLRDALQESARLARDLSGAVKPAESDGKDEPQPTEVRAQSEEALNRVLGFFGGIDPGSALPRAPDLQRRLLRRVESDWRLNALPGQLAPDGDWRTWLLMGGRGSGKTRAGAEWIGRMARIRPGLRIALVAETLGDAREVMIDGVSGLMRISGAGRPELEISRRRLIWPNGSIAQIFSAEDPESLRGPQFDLAWCDELGKWKYAEETWDMLQFGLRLGDHPRQLVTTTPRPIPLLKRLIADPGTVLRRLSTRQNRAHLAPGFIAAIETRYGGTRLGRQELDGDLIEDREDGLWTRAMLDRQRVRLPDPLSRVVVAVDPPASEQARGSCCGVVVAGIDGQGRGHVLADCSVENASPAAWAGAVVKAFHRFQADRVVAEINQGGDMVTALLRSVDADLPISTIRATRGKIARAEPVAALYEQGRVFHSGALSALEDQMCDLGPDGLSGGGSPDRVDALVWALTALMLTGRGEPRVRGV